MYNCKIEKAENPISVFIDRNEDFIISEDGITMKPVSIHYRRIYKGFKFHVYPENKPGLKPGIILPGANYCYLDDGSIITDRFKFQIKKKRVI